METPFPFFHNRKSVVSFIHSGQFWSGRSRCAWRPWKLWQNSSDRCRGIITLPGHRTGKNILGIYNKTDWSDRCSSSSGSLKCSGTRYCMIPSRNSSSLEKSSLLSSEIRTTFFPAFTSSRISSVHLPKKLLLRKNKSAFPLRESYAGFITDVLISFNGYVPFPGERLFRAVGHQSLLYFIRYRTLLSQNSGSATARYLEDVPSIT